MDIRPVTVAELLAKGQELFAQHHVEVGLDLKHPGDNLPLNIDGHMFARWQELGMLLSLGLFDGETLAGYAIGTLVEHQLVDLFVCSACALFVAPLYRRSGNGLRLMDAFEAEAAKRKATVHWHAKHGSRFTRILERRNAHELETVYVARSQP